MAHSEKTIISTKAAPNGQVVDTIGYLPEEGSAILRVVCSDRED
jgi:hypothetical protein